MRSAFTLRFGCSGLAEMMSIAPRRSLSLACALLSMGALSGISQLARPPEGNSDRMATLKLLEKRKAYEVANTKSFTAFSEFQFTDRISESGIRFEHQVVEDAAKSYKAAHYDHGNGVAAADVDGDGLVDLYFTTQLGTNQLWRNLGKGRFQDMTSIAGVGLPDQISVGASFADIDHDGDPDLFVTTVRHGNHLFENLGNGRFREITQQAGLTYSGHSSGAVFLDYDQDGLLDLFLVNVGIYTSNEKGPGGYFRALPDAFQGHLYPERTEHSILYHNLGGNRFEDVSAQMHLLDGSWSGDATSLDINGDNFPDLYVVNMQGDDHLYVNQHGKGFVDQTALYFPKTPWGAMGVKSFDMDQDGLMDLFVTDMHSDMTKPQTELGLSFRLDVERAKSEKWCAVQWTDEYLQGASNNIFGNAFYHNLGGGKFAENSDVIGAETYWPWGVSVGDVNADGYEDVFVTSGMGYPFRYAINPLLLNEHGRSFFNAEFLVGLEPRAGRRTDKKWFSLDCDGADKEHPECMGKSGRVDVFGTLSTRSSVLVDLDNDGDLDLVTNEFNDRPQILFSNLSEKTSIHFLKVQLQGTKSNRDGLGATVKVKIGNRALTQYHDGKSGYLAQSSLPLYFGLGTTPKADRIEVLWPSGKRQVVKEKIPENGLIQIIENGE